MTKDIDVATGLPGTITSVSYSPPAGMSFDEWSSVLHTFEAIETGFQYWIGDMLAFGETVFGEKYASAISPAQAKTWKNYCWVSRHVSPKIREQLPSFSHAYQLASIDPKKHESIAKRIGKEQLSVSSLRMALANEKRQEARKSLHNDKSSAETFNVIYADPPWQFENETIRASAEKHYTTMPLQDVIEYMQTAGIGLQDNAALFLWTTNAMLEDAFKVMAAWGFRYAEKNIVWEKEGGPGTGFSIRGCHEILLLGERGDFKPAMNIKPIIRSVQKAERGKHSEKPDLFRKIIERMYPETAKIELFARKHVKGWASMGDEL